MKDLKLTSLNIKQDKTTITIGEVTVGKDFVVVAGPCSVESEE